MLLTCEINSGIRLEDYNLYPSLMMGLSALKTDAETLIPKFNGRKLWFINSTPKGGGVAEMLPTEVNLLRQLGADCEWVVASSQQATYFTFTKKLHNLIHGVGDPDITSEEILGYESVNQQNAYELDQRVKPGDMIVIHDPQPMAIASFMKTKGIVFIWRCHIGTDERSDKTSAAWNFLRKYADPFHKTVFSATEYIPSYLSGKAVIIKPSIDPLSDKNEELTVHDIVAILCNAELVPEHQPVVNPPYNIPAKKLQPDGSFGSPLTPEETGLLHRPTILQVSRWDKLKGFLPLMQGYAELITNRKQYSESNKHNLRRIELSRLVLAGPDPDFVADDPEGENVLKQLAEYYSSLPSFLQEHISIIKLPMESTKINGLIVNALQRTATVIVQNSLKEGFGLTVTEAMWKIKPVIGTNTVGIRQQIQDHVDGIVIDDPTNATAIARNLALVLNSESDRRTWAYHAQKKVMDQFLIFSSLRLWLQLFGSLSGKVPG